MMDWRVVRIMLLVVLLAFLVDGVLELDDDEVEEDASLLLVFVFLSALIVVAEFVGVDSLIKVSEEAAGPEFNFDLTFTCSLFISSSLLSTEDVIDDDDAAAFSAGLVEKNIRCCCCS